MTRIIKDLEGQSRLTPARLVNVLWESAIDAFIKSIILLVMGSIALGIIGGIFHEMAPSLPPFLAGSTNSPSTSNSSVLHRWLASTQEHEFVIIFAIFFVVCARTRLVTAPDGSDAAQIPQTRFQKLGSRVSKEWFRLFVGNAFGALVSAIVIYFVETFTGTKLLFNLFLAAVLPVVKSISTAVFGSSIVNFVGDLFGWYGDNQLKFNFWLLYIAAVCDDLGLPNLKTLARFLWMRWRRQTVTPNVCNEHPPEPQKRACLQIETAREETRPR